MMATMRRRTTTTPTAGGAVVSSTVLTAMTPGKRGGGANSIGGGALLVEDAPPRGGVGGACGAVGRAAALCLYDPFWVSASLLGVFIVGMAVASPLVTPDAAGCSARELAEMDSLAVHHTTAAPHGSYRPGDFEVFMSGIAAGALLIQCSIIFSNAKRLRRQASAVAAFIFAESFTFFAMKAQGALSAVCVTQVGGTWAGTERTQYPARYLYWLASTPPIVAMLGRLAGASPGVVALGVLSDITVMATGMIASLTTNSLGGWAAALAVSFCANVVVMYLMARFMAEAYRRTLDARTQTVLRLAGPLALALWTAFPLVWCLREFGAIGDAGEGYAFPALDVLAKIVFSIVMVTGDFSRLDAEIEAELRVIDQERVSAEAANTAKKQFMRYLFHELRVPLNAVLLGVEDLYEAYAGVGDAEGTVDIVYNSANLMSKLLDDFLSLEKIEEGKLTLEPVDFRLGDMLGESVRTFAMPIQRKGLKVSLEIAPSVPALVYGDPNRLRQVISNFISNAIKFTPEGGTIRVRASLVYLRRDTGGGGRGRTLRGGGAGAAGGSLSPTASTGGGASSVGEPTTPGGGLASPAASAGAGGGGGSGGASPTTPLPVPVPSAVVVHEEHPPDSRGGGDGDGDGGGGGHGIGDSESDGTADSGGALGGALGRAWAALTALVAPREVATTMGAGGDAAYHAAPAAHGGDGGAAGAPTTGAASTASDAPQGLTLGRLLHLPWRGSSRSSRGGSAAAVAPEPFPPAHQQQHVGATAPPMVTLAPLDVNAPAFGLPLRIGSARSLAYGAADAESAADLASTHAGGSGGRGSGDASPVAVLGGGGVSEAGDREAYDGGFAGGIIHHPPTVGVGSVGGGSLVVLHSLGDADRPFSAGSVGGGVGGSGAGGGLDSPQSVLDSGRPMGGGLRRVGTGGSGDFAAFSASAPGSFGGGGAAPPMAAVGSSALIGSSGGSVLSGSGPGGGPASPPFGGVYAAAPSAASGGPRRIAMVRLAVTDRGIGISREEQRLLFRPFTQIRAGAAQKGGGTGLGLSICKRIMELSGGRIGVSSQPGRGSTFFIDLPLRPSALAAHSAQQGEAAAAAGAAAAAAAAAEHRQFLAEQQAASAVAAGAAGAGGSAASGSSTTMSPSPGFGSSQPPGGGVSASAAAYASGVGLDSLRLSSTAHTHRHSRSVASLASLVDDRASTAAAGSSGGRGSGACTPRGAAAAHHPHPHHIRSDSAPIDAVVGLEATPMPSSGASTPPSSVSSRSAGIGAADAGLVASALSHAPSARRSAGVPPQQAQQQLPPPHPAAPAAATVPAPPPPLQLLSPVHNAPQLAPAPAPSQLQQPVLPRHALGGGAAGTSGSASSTSSSSSSSSSSSTAPLLPPGVHPTGPTGAPLAPLVSAMVVDDVKSNRDLFGRLLSRKGVAHVSFADDGAVCIAAVRAALGGGGAAPAPAAGGAPPSAVVAVLPQAVMLDKEMPTDGHETAAALRAAGYAGAIIGVTGNALEEDRRAFAAAGADAVVTKPVRLAQLESQLAALGLYLPRGELAAAAAAAAAAAVGTAAAADGLGLP